MRLIACVLLVVACAGCAVAAAPTLEPAWVHAKISEYERLPVAHPPREILRTTYAGRTVDMVTATCCDIPGELYEESGKFICFPAGGFAGGDGNCPDFTLPPNAAIVWRDSRSP